MSLFPLEHETIEGNGRDLRRGRRSCVEVLDRCLDRIEEWEPRLKAWVRVDRDGAVAQAEALDAELAAGRCRGPLHGIPIGVKDIIDVEGLPTAAGYPPWADAIAPCDAPIVGLLRAAGVVILGKTATTQFAWIDPPPTRNPWDLERTPGGSSSGSAAAVAAGMCLGALGTQTGGSIIRPASFCGVAGLKPTFNGPEDGVLPFSPHLDHVGPIARSAFDLELLFREFLERDPAATSATAETVAVDLEVERRSRATLPPPRLGRFRGFHDRLMAPEMAVAFDRVLAAFGNAGAVVVDIPDPLDFEAILRDHRRIMAAEAAEGHHGLLRQAPELYRPRIKALVEEGSTVLAHDYLRARRHQEGLRKPIAHDGPPVVAFVTPATLGAAPDPTTTGDPSFNSPWSYTGTPAVSFPFDLAGDGLPLAIQLIATGPLQELELLDTARWCESVARLAHHARRV